MINKLKLWPLLPAAALIGMAVLFSQINFFTIKKVTCSLDGYPCPLAFEPILVSLHGQNIFKLNHKTVINQFLTFDLSLTDIKFNKRLPDNLAINLKRRLAIAQIVKTDHLDFSGLDSTQSASLSGELTSAIFLLDKNGDIFTQTDQINTQLPLISLPGNLDLMLGQNELSKALALLIVTLQSHFVSFTSLAWLDSNTYIIKTTAGPYAVLNPAKDFTQSVASLQYILSGFKIEEGLPTKIDLRFDKPILTF